MNQSRIFRFVLIAVLLIAALGASLHEAQAGQLSSQKAAPEVKLPPIMLRTIYVPGGAFGYPPSVNYEPDQWGLTVANSTTHAGFVVPQPGDWDQTTTFTVTLYFAMPLVLEDSVVNWRMLAGGAKINLPESQAGSGWDSLSTTAEDGVPLPIYAAGGHFDLMKSQSWTAKWSDMYHTWYFGGGVTSGNNFIGNPIWDFSFQRGASVGNGELYVDDIVIVGAEIEYWSIPEFYSATYLPFQAKP